MTFQEKQLNAEISNLTARLKQLKTKRYKFREDDIREYLLDQGIGMDDSFTIPEENERYNRNTVYSNLRFDVNAGVVELSVDSTSDIDFNRRSWPITQLRRYKLERV